VSRAPKSIAEIGKIRPVTRDIEPRSRVGLFAAITWVGTRHRGIVEAVERKVRGIDGDPNPSFKAAAIWMLLSGTFNVKRAATHLANEAARGGFLAWGRTLDGIRREMPPAAWGDGHISFARRDAFSDWHHIDFDYAELANAFPKAGVRPRPSKGGPTQIGKSELRKKAVALIAAGQLSLEKGVMAVMAQYDGARRLRRDDVRTEYRLELIARGHPVKRGPRSKND
jgi:hypothetical protein